VNGLTARWIECPMTHNVAIEHRLMHAETLAYLITIFLPVEARTRADSPADPTFPRIL